jgi:putative heme iron utilization protein
MKDALVYWLATSEDEIHFIDAIVSAYDGMAAVRRDFRMIHGRPMYKVYVSRGMEDEFLEVMERLRQKAAIEDLIRDDDEAAPLE